MKKVLKWGGIFLFSFFIFVTMIGFMSGDEAGFSEADALAKLKTYTFTESIKGQTAERTLDRYFSELDDSMTDVESGEWKVSEATGIENGYYVVYAYKEYGDYKNPKWLVTEEKIEAVDSESRLITPDLAPEGYDPQDQMIYDSFNSRLSELMDTQPSSTADQMDAIYEKAYQETASQYKVTSDEVKEVIDRAIKANAVK